MQNIPVRKITYKNKHNGSWVKHTKNRNHTRRYIYKLIVNKLVKKILGEYLKN